MTKTTNNNPVFLSIESLKVYFPIYSGFLNSQIKGYVKAVDNICMEIFKGETVGLVGESGCGKSTTGRTILQLNKPTSGKVIFQGTDLATLKGNQLWKMRKHLQMIFQDPYASLNPRMTVGKIIAEPLEIFGVVKGNEKVKRVHELLELVGMDSSYENRYPHEFSGGQRQRVGIARALSINPQFVVLDEPISSLDVSIQAQIVSLLKDLQQKYSLTYLFIAHDLSMVRHISDRVAVMYLGKIVETTKSTELYENPLHPYTKALLAAIPIPDPVVEENRNFIPLKGELPSPSNPPLGCNFSTRCPYVIDVCHQEEPEMKEVYPGHSVACHIVNSISTKNLPPNSF